MNRQKIVAGNWKMNKVLHESKVLVEAISTQLNETDNVLKIIIPPFPFLESISKNISGKKNLFLGAQNCHSHANGAFTGEVSAHMLSSVGCDYVLVGHSERRNYFKETDTELVSKIKVALQNNIKPIFCIGETLAERKNNDHFNVITNQLKNVLTQFTLDEFSNFIIAYEPVWAIGTGETATPEQAQEMHAFIRTTAVDIYDSSIAAQVPILYGGSCNAQNAKGLFACKDIDGGLIGGASLIADDFCKIVGSF